MLSAVNTPFPVIAVGILWFCLGIAIWRSNASGTDTRSSASIGWADRVGIMVIACGFVFLLVGFGPIDQDDWYFFGIGKWLGSNSSDPAAWASLFNEYSNPREPIFRPITYLWMTFASALCGTTWWAWHLLGMALHGLACVMVYRIAIALAHDSWTAFVAAALFFVHPACTEVFALINAQETTVMALLFMGSVLLHVNNKTILAGLLALVAMLTKEQAVTIVGALILTDLFQRKASFRRSAPVLAALVVLLGLRFGLLYEPDNEFHAEFTRQFLSLGVVDVIWGALVGVPALLTAPAPDGLSPVADWSLVVYAIALGSCLVASTRHTGSTNTLRMAVFALLWAVGISAPAISDLALPTIPSKPWLHSAWNGRHVYVALIIPCIACAWMFRHVPGRQHVRQWIARSAIILAVLGFWANAGPYVQAGERSNAVLSALDKGDWAENVAVRLVEPMDPIASVLVYRKLVDPSAKTLPLLVGEPRCGCTRLPLSSDLQSIPSIRALSTFVFSRQYTEAEIPETGDPCACTRWRQDAIWYAWKEDSLLPE